MTTQLEVCVADLAGVTAAKEGGADRLELCAALEIGGITPTGGFVREAIREELPVHVLIRARGGNFVYSPPEVESMRQDIADFQEIGVAGFVIGALTTESTLDMSSLKILHEACGDREVTLHRAFDQAADQNLALEQAIEMGFHRILTSGGEATAVNGLESLVRLKGSADKRIQIVPGGGIQPDNLVTILETLQPKEVHASCKSRSLNRSAGLVLGAKGNGGEMLTDVKIVRALSEIISDYA